MLANILKDSYNRDLNKLKLELMAYSNQSDLWLTDKEITNSAGNLCLHLIGNLKTYIGGALANSNYTRNRPEEFSQINISRNQLIKQIDAVIIEINQVLDTITTTALESDFPILVFDKKTTIAYILTHLTTHLSYHTGQINYHRRLLSS
ncbi:putative damage-inducible protein DinB [Flavobacterium sp. 7E]|uniref:DUF1572 family protein n=1 Tax=Flavobacterium sp. 7E TaxID=2735898 RepID=UPI00157017A7|nr:DUF1572 family protein [Flavobacterium sp. 7E]NRS90251.1 putative damage-inducible protein DinB [Flavobacterium sp. 7E]